MLLLVVLGSILSTGLCMPGGYSTVDSASATYNTYLDLLKEQKTTDLLGSLDVSGYTVSKIETQVVAGVNIKYTFNTNHGTCHIIIFDQSWTGIREVKDNSCAHKGARQLGGSLAGGYSVQNSPDEIKKYTDMLVTMESSAMLDSTPYTVQQVETQVVAGLNIRYTLQVNHATCKIVIFDQPWTNTRQVTENTCRHARRQLLGGYNNVDVNSPEIQKCLSLSVERVDSMSNSMYKTVNAGVVSASQQVVAGMNYDVTFQAGESACTKSDYMAGKVTVCPLNANSITTPTTWKGHCFRSLDGTFSLTDVDMVEEPTVDLPLDNDLGLTLKPTNSVKSKFMKVNTIMEGKVKDRLATSKAFLKRDQQPVVNLLRKKRNINFLIEKLDNMVDNPKDLNDIVEQGKAMLGGGDDHDLVNHVKDLIGQDGTDMIKHGGKILGGDGHDLVNHVEKILGGDNHDLIDHGKKLLGGDGHDLIAHGTKLLGGDDHDLVDHGSKLLGGDGHDLVDHGKKLLGGDGHDLVDHGKKLLGGDGHDLVDHGKKLIGGDGHDLVDHGKKLIGGDGHDLVDHGKKLIGGDTHDYLDHGKQKKPSKPLGGDGHDYCHMGMFNEFKAKFNKLYGSAKEEEKRFARFCLNMKMARKLQETEQGTAIYGATKFADLTKEEFQQYVGKKWDITANQGMKKAAIPRGSAPDSFDWRDHGAVTPVKNQGSCGSCWAFSTTGNIEGQWAIKKKKLVSLSEQELVDCDKVDEGCNGGLPSQAYKEIERLGGLETEKDYSYKGEDEKCLFNKTDVKVYINDSVSVSSDEAEMASWLAANGPISIGINAFAMQFYMGGISHPWKIFCNPKSLDHGVLIVGYGVQDDKPYWIVKNSWGPDWGEKGYYLVYRGAGVCGLNTMCTSAVVG